MGKTTPYKVGYGRPPVEHQFKPGQSGNPPGRKKGSKNLATIIAKASTETVAIKINGKSKTVPKLEAAGIQLANKAAAGDLKAVKLLTDLLTAAEAAAASAPAEAMTPEARRQTYALTLAALKLRLSGEDDHGG